MSGLTWLHLSDWHQGGNEFDREVVLQKLLEDIEKRLRISPELEQVDFVIFSGDVAYSGRHDQYETAKDLLFQPLLDACELGPDRLFIVAGNHDLNRDDFELLPHELNSPLASSDKVNYWLTDSRRRSHLLEPFRHFKDFVNNFTGQNPSDYANVQRWPISDKEIAILGLNSAWMCGRNQDARGKNNDYGYTLIGEPQIQSYIEEIHDADLRIAVFHHPFEWLAEFDCNRIERRLRRGCDFILNGHLHKPNVQFDFGGTLGNSVLIPAGTCYDRRIAVNPSYVNSYNFVHLDFDRKNCIVFLRRWSDQRTEWIKDIESYDGDGYYEFPLHIAVRQRSPPPSTTSYVGLPTNAIVSEQLPQNFLTIAISVSSDASLQGSKYSSIQAAVDAASAGDTIALGAGTYKENVHIDKSITITGAGVNRTTVDGNYAGSVLTVGENNPNIVVVLRAMSIRGGKGSPAVDPWPATGAYQTVISGGGGILNYGRLTIEVSDIRDNNAYEGGGIYNYGTLNLSSSTVCRNNAGFFAGGIANMGMLVLNSGEILDNAAMQGCGITNAGTLTLNVGSLICRNIATSGMGGGIWNRGTINMYDGLIEDNKVLQDTNGYGGDGGGICNDDPKGVVNIFGGKISGNSAWRGGGIYNYAGMVIMEGGSVENNQALQDSLRYGGQGAGINNDGIFIMNSGSISGNKADRSGGGIYSYNGVTIIKRGLISSNIASFGYGGGIYSDAGAVTFEGEDPLITHNKASQPYHEISWCKGRGVFLRTGTPTIKAGFDPMAQITDNTHI